MCQLRLLGRLHLLLVLVVLGAAVCERAGCTILRRDVLLERDVVTITSMERRSLNVALFMREHRVLRSKVVNWYPNLNQKGTNFVETLHNDPVDGVSDGVIKDVADVDLVGDGDGAVSAVCVASKSGMLSGAVVNELELEAGCARLWDVNDSMRASRLPTAPVSDMTKAYMRWRCELDGDLNKDFLLNGILNGFMIVDRDCQLYCLQEEL
jgi:hypothetical protein